MRISILLLALCLIAIGVNGVTVRVQRERPRAFKTKSPIANMTSLLQRSGSDCLDDPDWKSAFGGCDTYTKAEHVFCKLDKGIGEDTRYALEACCVSCSDSPVAGADVASPPSPPPRPLVGDVEVDIMKDGDVKISATTMGPGSHKDHISRILDHVVDVASIHKAALAGGLEPTPVPREAIGQPEPGKEGTESDGDKETEETSEEEAQEDEPASVIAAEQEVKNEEEEIVDAILDVTGVKTHEVINSAAGMVLDALSKHTEERMKKAKAMADQIAQQEEEIEESQQESEATIVAMGGDPDATNTEEEKEEEKGVEEDEEAAELPTKKNEDVEMTVTPSSETTPVVTEDEEGEEVEEDEQAEDKEEAKEEDILDPKDTDFVTQGFDAVSDAVDAIADIKKGGKELDAAAVDNASDLADGIADAVDTIADHAAAKEAQGAEAKSIKSPFDDAALDGISDGIDGFTDAVAAMQGKEGAAEELAKQEAAQAEEVAEAAEEALIADCKGKVHDGACYIESALAQTCTDACTALDMKCVEASAHDCGACMLFNSDRVCQFEDCTSDDIESFAAFPVVNQDMECRICKENETTNTCDAPAKEHQHRMCQCN